MSNIPSALRRNYLEKSTTNFDMKLVYNYSIQCLYKMYHCEIMVFQIVQDNELSLHPLSVENH